MAILFPDEDRVVCPDWSNKLFEVKQVYSLLQTSADSYIADTGTYVIVCANCGKEIKRLVMEPPYPGWASY